MFNVTRNVLAQYSILTFVFISVLSSFLGVGVSQKITDYLIKSHIEIYP